MACHCFPSPSRRAIQAFGVICDCESTFTLQSSLIVPLYRATSRIVSSLMTLKMLTARPQVTALPARLHSPFFPRASVLTFRHRHHHRLLASASPHELSGLSVKSRRRAVPDLAHVSLAKNIVPIAIYSISYFLRPKRKEFDKQLSGIKLKEALSYPLGVIRVIALTCMT